MNQPEQPKVIRMPKKIISRALNFLAALLTPAKCPYCKVTLEPTILGSLICPECSYDAFVGRRLF